MKKILSAVLLLLLPTVAQPAIGTDPLGDWQLVWSDEFDDVNCTSEFPCSPDATKWIAREGNLWQNDPVDIPFYTSRLENVRVQNGSLIIETRKDAYGGKNYTSGSIDTYKKKHFQFGKLEIRAKGTSLVNNVDQAIWTLGASGPWGGLTTWPDYGEVDILEYFPGSSYWGHTKVSHAFHTQYKEQQLYESNLDARNWHVYSMEWDNTVIKILVDGVVKVTKNKTVDNDWPWMDPVFLLITTQLGSIGGGTIDDFNFPLQFEVDYVRYYQFGTPNPPNPPNPSPLIPSAPGKIRVN